MKNKPRMMGPCGWFMQDKHPSEMFARMMAGADENEELAKYATPELCALFEDWLIQLEQEVIEFVDKNNTRQVETIAKEFKISEESAGYILTRLSEKIKFKS